MTDTSNNEVNKRGFEWNDFGICKKVSFAKFNASELANCAHALKRSVIIKSLGSLISLKSSIARFAWLFLI